MFHPLTPTAAKKTFSQMTSTPSFYICKCVDRVRVQVTVAVMDDFGALVEIDTAQLAVSAANGSF